MELQDLRGTPSAPLEDTCLYRAKHVELTLCLKGAQINFNRSDCKLLGYLLFVYWLIIGHLF